MSHPAIVFVPGFWEGTAAFSIVVSMLQSDGFEAVVCPLLSTGQHSPGNPSMLDDIAAIRKFLEGYVLAGKEVLLVLHSASGLLGSHAIEGLGYKVRKEKGLSGGVTHIVFMAAAVFAEGFAHKPLPFFKYDKEGELNCVDPRHNLFNDLDDEAAQKWIDALQCQPAAGWDDTVTYCGWRDVESTYLVCEGDQIMKAPLQLQFAELAGSKIERCSAGHMVNVSMPEKVVGVVKMAAELQ
ncbi:Alpha/beta hydrolase fold-1 [Xylogone sp. PMI_703]|nr:Alpha/beta hydrolase fold-1 [Xylogone sp. PMI_703]